MATLDTSPVIFIVGDADIASLKVAVMVTTLEPETKLSESVSVKVTVGAVLSMVKVILVVPAKALPERSVPATVADTIPLVVVETVHG